MGGSKHKEDRVLPGTIMLLTAKIVTICFLVANPNEFQPKSEERCSLRRYIQKFALFFDLIFSVKVMVNRNLATADHYPSDIFYLK